MLRISESDPGQKQDEGRSKAGRSSNGYWRLVEASKS